MKKDIRNTFLFQGSRRPSKKEFTDAKFPVALPSLETKTTTEDKRAVWYDHNGKLIGHSSYYAARKFCANQVNKKVNHPYDNKGRFFAHRMKFNSGWIVEDRKTTKYLYYIIEE